jgi:hypothetical protein
MFQTHKFYIFILNTSANKIKHYLQCQYNFVNSMGSHNVRTLTECTGTVFYIWPDDG